MKQRLHNLSRVRRRQSKHVMVWLMACTWVPKHYGSCQRGSICWRMMRKQLGVFPNGQWGFP